MNTSLTNGTRSATPIIARDFDKSINQIKKLNQILPEIKNTVVENKVINLKNTTNYAKQTIKSINIISEMMERARTEKILTQYSKR